MQPTDIQLVPLDADETTLKSHLDASPAWTRTGGTNVVAAYRHDDPRYGAYRVFVPIHDDPDFPPDPDDDHEECARAAYAINAVALRLPTETHHEVIDRLVAIYQAAEPGSPIALIASGQVEPE
ncbi:hypothetical protein [Nonomuraea sp. GTA35]|uniref:hypothetical protein n=1 Tax=Nonomuraea sp. GTA35 TaxID=1676746 RepID=UPI0035C10D53